MYFKCLLSKYICICVWKTDYLQFQASNNWWINSFSYFTLWVLILQKSVNDDLNNYKHQAFMIRTGRYQAYSLSRSIDDVGFVLDESRVNNCTSDQGEWMDLIDVAALLQGTELCSPVHQDASERVSTLKGYILLQKLL